MCGSKSKAAPAPAPAPVPQYYPEGARTQQDIAAANTTPSTPSFGSELGTGAAATPTGS